jgi:hypothetical protein
MAGQDFLNHLVPGGCLIDVKGMLDPAEIRQNGFYFWRL